MFKFNPSTYRWRDFSLKKCSYELHCFLKHMHLIGFKNKRRVSLNNFNYHLIDRKRLNEINFHEISIFIYYIYSCFRIIIRHWKYHHVWITDWKKFIFRFDNCICNFTDIMGKIRLETSNTQTNLAPSALCYE